MSETPPPYAQYPRNAPSSGDSSHLQALADGYFGLNIVFLVNVALVIVWRVASIAVGARLALPLLLVVGLGVGFLSFPYNKKIGYGANWSPTQPVLASVLMGINSALCCGIIGFAVMQTIAGNHMKRYGIKMSLFGGKKQVQQKIAELQAQGN